MPGHRPGVAEAEVDVVVTVDIGEVGAGRGLHVERERAGPADHPVHGHAGQERSPRPCVEGVSTRMTVDEVGQPPFALGGQDKEQLQTQGCLGTFEGPMDEIDPWLIFIVE